NRSPAAITAIERPASTAGTSHRATARALRRQPIATVANPSGSAPAMVDPLADGHPRQNVHPDRDAGPCDPRPDRPLVKSYAEVALPEQISHGAGTYPGANAARRLASLACGGTPR